jgi:hypothetical protein
LLDPRLSRAKEICICEELCFNPDKEDRSRDATMTIAELIFEQVKKLPDSAAREVLDFVGYLRESGERAEWRDLMSAQSSSLAPVWDNAEDRVWDDV